MEYIVHIHAAYKGSSGVYGAHIGIRVKKPTCVSTGDDRKPQGWCYALAACGFVTVTVEHILPRIGDSSYQVYRIYIVPHGYA